MADGWGRTPNLPVPESVPPTGRCKIVNFYFDPETGMIVVEYDNKPIE